MKSNKEIEKDLAFARFNMACEGFILTKEDENAGKMILRGQITDDKAVQEVLKRRGLVNHG